MEKKLNEHRKESIIFLIKNRQLMFGANKLMVEVRLDFEVEVEVRLLDLFLVVFLQIGLVVVVSYSFV